MKINLNRFMLIAIAIIVIILDQLSKYIVRSKLRVFAVVHFLPLWNWTLAYNQGAAFSFLADASGWQRIFFSALAIIVAIVLIYYILFKSYTMLNGLAMSLILGGAIGNLIDRLNTGYVTDFIDWYYSNHHWPAFNLADSCITVGIVLLIIDNLFNSQNN